jgi:hypothetical protein
MRKGKNIYPAGRIYEMAAKKKRAQKHFLFGPWSNAGGRQSVNSLKSLPPVAIILSMCA